MPDDFDDFEFDSESEEEHKEDEGGKRPVHDLAQIISDEAGTDFAWTTEHVLLCRLISLYGRCALKPGEQETWVRSVALNVLIYECITAGVLDFDYAPVLTDISYRGESKRVWLNLSQEAMAVYTHTPHAHTQHTTTHTHPHPHTHTHTHRPSMTCDRQA